MPPYTAKPPDLDEIRLGDRVMLYGKVYTLTTKAWSDNHDDVALTFTKTRQELAEESNS